MSSAPWLAGLLRLLERRTGLVIGERGAALLEAAFEQEVQRTMQSAMQLLESLSDEPEHNAWDALLKAATIPETHFYRVVPQMLALETEILPELLSRQTRSLRIWSAGCSSGEEAYTLAILLEQGAARLNLPQQAHSAKVLGTDLSPHALELARIGRYGAWSFRGTPVQWRERYFHPLEDEPPATSPRWEVTQRIRRRVEFKIYNLVEPPPDQKPHYDLIVCRNVTLYFRPQVAQAVYRHLASRLSPGGYLLLGPSDPPLALSGPRHSDSELSRLEQRSAPGAFYWQKELELKPEISPSREFTLTPGYELAPSRVTSRVTPQPSSLPNPAHSAFSTTTLLERGLSLLERGEATAALEPLRRAAYQDPTDAFTHFLLGRAWLTLNLPARAKAALLHAQSLLEGLQPEVPLTSAPELTALDLRHALERLLLTLDPPDSR